MSIFKNFMDFLKALPLDDPNMQEFNVAVGSGQTIHLAKDANELMLFENNFFYSGTGPVHYFLLKKAKGFFSCFVATRAEVLRALKNNEFLPDEDMQDLVEQFLHKQQIESDESLHEEFLDEPLEETEPVQTPEPKTEKPKLPEPEETELKKQARLLKEKKSKGS